MIRIINEQTDLFLKYQETLDANIQIKKLQQVICREGGFERLNEEGVNFIIKIEQLLLSNSPNDNR